MTGKELIEKLQSLTDEEKELRVKFYNPKYEIYEEVSEIHIIEDCKTGRKFTLLNEG